MIPQDKESRRTPQTRKAEKFHGRCLRRLIPPQRSHFVMAQEMTSPDAGEIVEDAFDSGRIEEDRLRLDAWQATQPLNLGTYSALRYYRALLGQDDEAIDAAKSILNFVPLMSGGEYLIILALVNFMLASVILTMHGRPFLSYSNVLN